MLTQSAEPNLGHGVVLIKPELHLLIKAEIASLDTIFRIAQHWKQKIPIPIQEPGFKL